MGYEVAMTLIRLVARPMLASMFVMGGYSALRNPDQHVRMAKPVTDKLSGVAEQATENLPIAADEKQLVIINGAAQVIAGLALATGRFPRLSATVLAATLVPTTAAGHRFWEETDKTQRANQTIHFVKNVSMMGGLLLAAVDTEGKPGVAWRASHAVGSARRSGKVMRKQARMTAKLAGKQAKSQARHATKRVTS
jgi:putative oxidoreductase